jgi:hypothetical protein
MHPFFTPPRPSDYTDALIRRRVWLALVELALDEADIAEQRRRDWKAAIAAFLAEFKNPGRVLRWEVRNYLYGKTELGARAGAPGAPSPARSLPVAQAALAFFFETVLPRPLLAEIARNPFLPAQTPEPEWMDARLAALTRPWIFSRGVRGTPKPAPVFPTRTLGMTADAGSDWSPRPLRG